MHGLHRTRARLANDMFDVNTQQAHAQHTSRAPPMCGRPKAYMWLDRDLLDTGLAPSYDLLEAGLGPACDRPRTDLLPT